MCSLVLAQTYPILWTWKFRCSTIRMHCVLLYLRYLTLKEREVCVPLDVPGKGPGERNRLITHHFPPFAAHVVQVGAEVRDFFLLSLSAPSVRHVDGLDVVLPGPHVALPSLDSHRTGPCP